MKKIVNEIYEVTYQEEYEAFIKKVLNYSTVRLKKVLNFFEEDEYGSVIKASFFDNREDFEKRIKEIDKNANPPKWATGCFYGGENQILFNKDNLNNSFYTLCHESCHLLFNKYIYNNYKERITWLDESFVASFCGDIDSKDDEYFIKLTSMYLNKDLPNMNEINKKNGNIVTDKYNAYHFFHLIGKYLREILNDKELLVFYKNEDKVVEIGNHILDDSLNYFKNKYSIEEIVKDVKK